MTRLHLPTSSPLLSLPGICWNDTLNASSSYMCVHNKTRRIMRRSSIETVVNWKLSRVPFNFSIYHLRPLCLALFVLCSPSFSTQFTASSASGFAHTHAKLCPTRPRHSTSRNHHQTSARRHHHHRQWCFCCCCCAPHCHATTLPLFSLHFIHTPHSLMNVF